MSESSRLLRFACVGLVAAGVHFGLLYTCYRVLGLPSAAASSIIAAVGGITTSFFGNRHVVFRAAHQPAASQAWRFALLYAFTATMHGLVLLYWTDIAGRDYRVGFLLATALQVAASYAGNRYLVFGR